MKRILVGLMAAALSLSMLTGCGQQAQSNPAGPQQEEQNGTAEQQPAVEAGYEEGVVTHVAALKGPTSMGLVQLIKDNEGVEGAPYEFAMYTAGDEVVPLIAKGEVDIALIPTNLAAALYQKTEGGVQVLNVNAGNVLYAVSHDEALTTLEGLKGKTVYMTGKGTTPEWTLRYLLGKNDIVEDDLTIEFKSEATEVVSALSEDVEAVGILPQPFATVAMMQDQEMSVNFSLDDAWREINSEGIATGVTIVRKAFAEEHPAAVAQFLIDHQQSVQAVSENPEEAGQLIEEYGIVKAGVAAQVIANFNPLSAETGETMKTWVSSYLEALYEVDPAAVGGTLPDEGFYYLG